MVKIERVLTYEFPDIKTAVTSLQNRGVKGVVTYGHNKITERFYASTKNQKSVLNAVLTHILDGEAPHGNNQ